MSYQAKPRSAKGAGLSCGFRRVETFAYDAATGLEALPHDRLPLQKG